MRFSQGDIVVVELPFTDFSGSKRRPALVLNAVDLNRDLIVAKITKTPGKHRVPIFEEDMEEGELAHYPSYVDVTSIFTSEKRFCKRVGRVSSAALERVKEELRIVLGV